jgi:hypothetical protein
MKLEKRSNGHYINVKLSSGDWKYLTNLAKRETPKFIKEVDRQFKELVAMQIQTLSVIQFGDMLRRKKVIGDVDINRLLNDMDGSMRKHHSLIQKYYKQYGNIFKKATRGKKKTLDTERGN